MKRSDVIAGVLFFLQMAGADAGLAPFVPQSLATTFQEVHSSGPKQLPSSAREAVLKLRGGVVLTIDDVEVAQNAFGWCSNLGAPAALVGGAVLATMVETRNALSPNRSDTRSRRVLKKLTRFLLASAFALEITTIFVTTVMGTMLMAQGDRPTGTAAGKEYVSAMGFLRHNHEFEYLTARITFLQGLFNWLLATAMELAMPNEGEGETARRMNGFISSAIVTIVLFMLSFYNAHMTFYDNYFGMLWRYAQVAGKRFFWTWPMRPLSILYIPSSILTLFLGFRALYSPPDKDLD